LQGIPNPFDNATPNQPNPTSNHLSQEINYTAANKGNGRSHPGGNGIAGFQGDRNG
jgi:hypothetical protein